MAEINQDDINFEDRWHDNMVELAAGDRRLIRLASWITEQSGDYNDPDDAFDRAARYACGWYDLHSEEDYQKVLGRSEELVWGIDG